MSPSAIDDVLQSHANGIDTAATKQKGASNHREFNEAPGPPPVADDYMYDFKYNHPLPTCDVLGVTVPLSRDAQVEAGHVVKQLSDALEAEDAVAFSNLFLEHGKLAARSDRPILVNTAHDLL